MSISEAPAVPAETLLTEARECTDRRLDEVAGRLRASVPGTIGDAFAYALQSPGKRVRPALVLAAYRSAGGHSGTFTPGRPLRDRPLPDLVAEIRAGTSLPVVAAGGVARPEHVRAALAVGADAVAVGTALLLAPEAGTSRAHRSALTQARRGDTRLTRAFTGRPARGLPNDFMARYDDLAPLGYPALHHLTSPIRKASAALSDPEQDNVWAGTGYREITERPAAEILADLAAGA